MASQRSRWGYACLLLGPQLRRMHCPRTAATADAGAVVAGQRQSAEHSRSRRRRPVAAPSPSRPALAPPAPSTRMTGGASIPGAGDTRCVTWGVVQGRRAWRGGSQSRRATMAARLPLAPHARAAASRRSTAAGGRAPAHRGRAHAVVSAAGVSAFGQTIRTDDGDSDSLRCSVKREWCGGPVGRAEGGSPLRRSQKVD
jgi:hypothetical protein